MTPDERAEARAWTRLDGWGWRPGMLDLRWGRVHAVRGSIVLVVQDEGRALEWRAVDELDRPVVTDDATRGALLGLAREITGYPDLSVSYHLCAHGWRWCAMTRHVGGGPLSDRVRETEALLAACEAAEWVRRRAERAP